MRLSSWTSPCRDDKEQTLTWRWTWTWTWILSNINIKAIFFCGSNRQISKKLLSTQSEPQFCSKYFCETRKNAKLAKKRDSLRIFLFWDSQKRNFSHEFCENLAKIFFPKACLVFCTCGKRDLRVKPTCEPQMSLWATGTSLWIPDVTFWATDALFEATDVTPWATNATLSYEHQPTDVSLRCLELMTFMDLKLRLTSKKFN
jgi:hypothetical protein